MEKLFSIYESLYNDRVFFVCKSLFTNNGAIVECFGATGIYIDLDQIKTAAEECVAVAHEAGHYYTGTTYGIYSRHDLIAKREAMADRWAIKKLIPEDELRAAFEKGYTEPWELAEFFNVPESFVKKAAEHYTRGGFIQ